MGRPGGAGGFNAPPPSRRKPQIGGTQGIPRPPGGAPQNPGLLAPGPRQIGAVPAPAEPSHDPEVGPPSRLLGRAVAGGLAALFVMVGLGVFWVWQRSTREQAWRDRINAAEPFTAPPPVR